MFKDISGYVLTISSEISRAAWERLVEGVLSHAAATPSHLDAVLKAEPQFAIGYAVKGLLLLSLARRELLPDVQHCLQHAVKAAAARPVAALAFNAPALVALG